MFADAFGSDYIYDFDQADGDKIEFQVAGVDSFDDLNIQQSGANTVITTSASTTDSVTLVAYDASSLATDDFLFT